MKTRHLLIEAYLHVLAFALLCMGAVSLVGVFSWSMNPPDTAWCCYPTAHFWHF